MINFSEGRTYVCTACPGSYICTIPDAVRGAKALINNCI